MADRSPGSAAEATRTAQIVINATPGAGSLERLTALRAELRGRILVDVSNATVDGPDGLRPTCSTPAQASRSNCKKHSPTRASSRRSTRCSTR